MGAALTVTVVGAGLTGAACAAVLRQAGVPVRVVDRGRAPGGRMASPELHGRRVDIGAAYFTAKDDAFAAVVAEWARRGLVREWTDTFDVFDGATRRASSGPMRYAAPGGLRSLVRDLLAGSQQQTEITSLDDLDGDAVVLAMPDPQAARLLGTAPDALEWVDYEPVIAVAAGWDKPSWALDAAAFVNDDPDLTLIADDGSRRGDGAPVLVAHTTHDRARMHLDDPDGAIEPVLDAVRRLLHIDVAPRWTRAHRWGFAKPAGTHGDDPFGLLTHRGRLLGLANDAWCPSGAPRIESAWLAGHRLGVELAARLA